MHEAQEVRIPANPTIGSPAGAVPSGACGVPVRTVRCGRAIPPLSCGRAIRAVRCGLALALLALAPSSAAAQTLADLRPAIEERVAAHQGTVGLAVIDLDTGEALAIRGDEPFPTASVIKVPVLVEVFHQVENGPLRLEDPLVLIAADRKPGSGILQHLSTPHELTVADAALLMIAHSDNTATNLLIDRVGIGPVNARMDSLGLPRTTLHRKLFGPESSSIAPDSSARYGVGVTTPAEMAGLLAMLYRGEVVSAPASERMLEILRRQFYRESIPRHLAGAPVANKTGSESAVRNDCGVVYGEARDFVLCVFTRENRDRSWSLDNEAQVLAADLARILYEGLNGR